MTTGTLETKEMLLNMGPQHPSTHGVLHLRVRTDGEMIRECTPIIGYLHRCGEKIGESVRYEQFVPYTDRLDYLSSMGDNLAYCLAVEKLLQVEVPPRAQSLRVIMAELNRIASHLVAFGCFGMDLGAFTPFLYAFREREAILDMFERVSGARLTYNYIKIGGCRKDADGKFADLVRRFLDSFDARLQEYNDILTYNRIFIKRTRGVGILPAKLAVDYAVTGPNLRASGVDYDVRKAMPYSSYDRFEFKTCLGRDGVGILGDCWNRYFVRIEEMIESCKIVRRALEGLPEGKISADVKKVRPPKGEVYGAIENPRGELGFHVVSDGTDKPARLKIRAPSFVNLSVLPELSKDILIADLVAILGSLDIVLGEIDR